MYIIYSKEKCANCRIAKAILKMKGLDYEERMAGVDYELDYLRGLGVRQLPYIIEIDGDLFQRDVGGLEELQKELF